MGDQYQNILNFPLYLIGPLFLNLADIRPHFDVCEKVSLNLVSSVTVISLNIKALNRTS